MIPIYIPSKGRAATAQTPRLLLSENIDFTLMVEPQDYNEYIKYFSVKNIFKLEYDNAGIAYVRNQCKKLSLQRNENEHWQLDDNIKTFRKRINNKNVICSAREVLEPLEKYYYTHVNVGMVCLRHVMYAFSQEKDLSFNQCMYSAFITKNKVDIWFKHGTIEDADYTLKMLKKNYCTVIFNRLLMEKETSGKMKGGNTEISHSGNGRLERALQLCNDYPDWFYIVDKNGQKKAQPKRVWQTFKQRPILRK